MDNLELKLLRKNDKDLAYIKATYLLPKISDYIKISDDYFDNIAIANNVWYYKLLKDNQVIGAVHVETNEEALYLVIWIQPTHQRQGYAQFCLETIIDLYSENIKRVEVTIDQKNLPSINLFEKLGFTIENFVDGIYYYVKKLN